MKYAPENQQPDKFGRTSSNTAFLGVDERRTEHALQPGVITYGENIDLSSGRVDPRRGLSTVGWGGLLAWRYSIDTTTPFDLNAYNWPSYEQIYGQNFRFQAGNTIQFLRPSTATWHTWKIGYEERRGYYLDVEDKGQLDSEYEHRALNLETANFRILEDKIWQLRNEDGGFHTLYLQGSGDDITLHVSQIPMDPGTVSETTLGLRNFQIYDDTWQLLNITSGEYHTIFTNFWDDEDGLRPAVMWNLNSDTALDDASSARVDMSEMIGLGDIKGVHNHYQRDGSGRLHMVAVADQVWLLNEHMRPRSITLPPDLTLEEYRVRLISWNGYVLLYRGAGFEDQPPLIWDPTTTEREGLHPFQYLTQELAETIVTFGSGETLLAFGRQPTVVGNFLALISGVDIVQFSGIGQFIVKEPQFEFPVTSQFGERAITLASMAKNRLVVGKDHSVHIFENVVGDLSANVSKFELTSAFGFVSEEGWTRVGNDIWFMSREGLKSVRLNEEDIMRSEATSLDFPLEDTARRINWGSIWKCVMASYNGKVYIAIPINGSSVCNAIMVYSFHTSSWHGIYTRPKLAVHSFLTVDHSGEERLAIFNEGNSRPQSDDSVPQIYDRKASGAMMLVDHLEYDDLYGEQNWIKHRWIDRAHTPGDLDTKRFYKIDIDVYYWHAEFIIRAYSEGVNEVSPAVLRVTTDSSKMTAIRQKPYDITNIDDNHATPYREDYSISLAPGDIFYGKGKSEIRPMLHQQRTFVLNPRLVTKYMRIEVESIRGRSSVMSLSVEAQKGFTDYLVRS